MKSPWAPKSVLAFRRYNLVTFRADAIAIMPMMGLMMQPDAIR